MVAQPVPAAVGFTGLHADRDDPAHRYREAFSPSGAKDDPSDAELALEVLLTHPERFKPLNPQSAQMHR